MEHPKVSIIIATYNAAKTLSIALDSVLNQICNDWECIIVDGASKDDTIDIVKSYAQRDSRFRYISEPDKGIYDAFNKGWKLANGEWIHYLGSDDYLTRDGISELLKYTNEADLISGNTYIIKRTGKIVKQISKGIRGCHQSKITKKSIIEKIGGFDERFKVYADADMMFKILTNGYNIKNVPVFVSYFSTSGVSQSFRSTVICAKEKYVIYKSSKVFKFPLLMISKEITLRSLSILKWNLLNYLSFYKTK